MLAEVENLGIMHPLLAEATQAQKRLLEVAYDAYSPRGLWPIYQYVEAILFQKEGLDSRSAVSGRKPATSSHRRHRERASWSVPKTSAVGALRL